MNTSVKPVIEDLKIRFADENDTELILDFIKKLADYEKRFSEVVSIKDDIREVFFDRKIAEAIIGEYCGKPVGFAVFFYNFSTCLFCEIIEKIIYFFESNKFLLLKRKLI